jgi:hypothetical protein
MSRYRIVMIELAVQEASEALSKDEPQMIHYAEWLNERNGSIFETTNLDEARDKRDYFLGIYPEKFDYQIVELVS